MQSAKRSPELTSVPDLHENVIHAGCSSSLALWLSVALSKMQPLDCWIKRLGCFLHKTHATESRSPAAKELWLPLKRAFVQRMALEEGEVHAC